MASALELDLQTLREELAMQDEQFIEQVALLRRHRTPRSGETCAAS
jgi:hypothetical protein